MKILPWLVIDSKHPVYRSGKMEFLEIFPSNSTSEWLTNHRNFFKAVDGKFIISCRTADQINPEIESQEQPYSLHFYLGTKDLNFSSFTDCSDQPLHSHSLNLHVDIQSVENNIININLKDAEVVEGVKPVSLPSGYFKIGELKINIESIPTFIKSNISKGPTNIVINAHAKSYKLVYAIDKLGNSELMPTEIVEESGITTFNQIEVDNSNHTFFASNDEIGIDKLNLLECVPYRVQSNNIKTKLKCKVPKFGVSNISKSPSYPHLPILLQEIKY